MRISGEFLLPSEKLPEVITVNAIGAEQRNVQKEVASFIRQEILQPEIIERIEAKDIGLMKNLLLAAQEKLGLLGVDVPEEYGGSGMDKLSSALIAEEAGKQASFACSFLAHTGIGTAPILYFGTEEQKRKYLPKLASGEWLAAFALTEAGAGSDASAAKTTATLTPSGGGYYLTGEKIFITNGNLASLFTVFAKLNGKLTAFIVDRDCITGDCSGVSIGKEEHKMGIRGSSTAPLVLNNVFVPPENLIWAPGKGFKIAMSVLNIGRFKLGAACLGAGRYCFADALGYARTRKQFGQPLFSFGLTKEKLAEMFVRIYAMESVVYRTAGLIEEELGSADTSKPESVAKALQGIAVECALVKVFCSEASDYIIDENVQIHGGLGYCEGDAERFYRDARINRIFEGTNEINRLFAVGAVLKKASELGLMPAIKIIQKSLLESPPLDESSDLIDNLFARLNNAKKITLLASGAAFMKFGEALEAHQFVIGQLSDCLIELYSMESGLCALAQMPASKNEALTRLMFLAGTAKIESCVKNIFAACQEGDGLRTSLAVVRRFLKFVPENKEALYETILSDSQ